jgi:serine/threonine protein kinase
MACQARFLVEAQVTGRLEHPGVVPVYGLGRFPNGRPYYAMRFIRGKTLAEASKSLHQEIPDQERKRIALRRLVERFLDVCDAVAYAHARGILHRDLKPNNVMLGKYGETLVLDWGLTKSLGHGHRADDSDEETLPPDSGSGTTPTEYGKAIGSPHYMSPEQAAGKLNEIGPATDVFGLGATLYHLLCGVPPIDAPSRDAALNKAMRGDFPSPYERNRDVPVALAEICMKAMSVQPQDRYASVLWLRAAVQDWLDNEPISGLLATVKHFESLHEQYPHRAEYQQRLGRELSVLSKVAQSLARYDDSLMYAERAVYLLDALFQHKPSDLWRYEELFLARAQLANVYRATAKEEQAVQIEEKNRLDFQRLMKQSSGSPEVREEFMSVTLHQGFSLDEAEKLLKDHRSAADTVVFEEERSGEARPAVTDPFQKLFQTLTGDSRYQLIEKLGEGGVGIIYRARDKLLPRVVALKTARDVKQGGYVFFEACLLGRLSHPNIAPVYDLGLRKDGTPFFTTKLLLGQNWGDLASNRPGTKRACFAHWRRLLAGFVKVCDALHHAHQRGVIHCDPKPSNVLVDAECEPWLIDWGIGRIIAGIVPAIASEDERLRQLFFPPQGEGLAGTPAYMSPEQARGARIDARSDVFALGGTLFTLLTGGYPYPQGPIFETLNQRISPNLITPSPRTIDRRIPRRLASICLKAMESKPENRYQTARELGEDVRRWLGNG